MSKKENNIDRKGKQIEVGDILLYYAGSKRDIQQEYVAESLMEGPDDYKSAPNCFRAIGHDGQLQHLQVPLFCLDKWSEVVGNSRDTNKGT